MPRRPPEPRGQEEHVGPVIIETDLQFSDSRIEQEYSEAHNESQFAYDVALAVGIRCLGWSATAWKTWRRGEATPAAVTLMLVTCCASSLLPVAAMLPGMQFYRKYACTARRPCRAAPPCAPPRPAPAPTCCLAPAAQAPCCVRGGRQRDAILARDGLLCAALPL